MTNVGNDSFKPYVRPQDWKWHDCHHHYHSIEVLRANNSSHLSAYLFLLGQSMAYYEVADSNGVVLAEGRKNSFCLEDTACEGGGSKKKFECSNVEDATLPQGISPGCSDAYTCDY
jgi:lysyl oxidase-like protein 2/3/4